MEELNGTPEVSAEAAAQPVAEEASNVEVGGNAPEASTTEEATAPAEGGEQEGESEFVKDDQGNEFIPRAAFEARLAKMAEQKHNAIGQFVESLRSNPEAKQQVLEALGVKSDATGSQSPEAAPETSQFETWMQQNVQPEYHAHYKQMADAMYQTIMPHIREMYQSELKPILSVLGKQEVQKFATAHPDYGQYKDKINQLITSGRAKSLEDAYKIVAWDNKMKGAGAAALSSENARKAKLANSPIRRAQSSPAGRQKPGSLREAFEQSAREIGYQQ